MRCAFPNLTTRFFRTELFRNIRIAPFKLKIDSNPMISEIAKPTKKLSGPTLA